MENLPDHIKQVRVMFADQHGICRGKTVNRQDYQSVVQKGLPLTSSLLLKDTSHKTVFQPFSGEAELGLPDLQGAADFLVMPDITTEVVLPWQPNTLWLLGDGVSKSGAPLPFCSRSLLKRHLDALGTRGFELLVGIELEFHLFQVVSSPKAISLPGKPGAPCEVLPLSKGSQYLTENQYDQMEPALEAIREALASLGVEPKSIEIEFGASQVEMSFYPMPALVAADRTMLIRNTVKQVCARQGLHATFMCKPAAPATMASGWHLHQSLVVKGEGTNAFQPRDPAELLSRVGTQYAAGLLQHAGATTLLCCPTVNSYKRFQPYAMAPLNVCWGVENRGAMLRVVTTADGRGNHVENRLGDPTANPYLYIAGQLVAGMLGLQNGYELPAAADTPYAPYAAARLPAHLGAAVGRLLADTVFKNAFGSEFLEYLCFIKEAELARFNGEVTDWEQREYFEVY